ncbi:MAG: hypothetical protein JKY90_02070 [Gammaproteobacteria bacterium]|nr:hypothetical protein [Gammaproteobacteria bacterium]
MKAGPALLLLLLAIPGLALARECDYDNAFAVALNSIASKVPDMEKHAPYQVIEHDNHWAVTGYNEPSGRSKYYANGDHQQGKLFRQRLPFHKMTQNLST